MLRKKYWRYEFHLIDALAAKSGQEWLEKNKKERGIPVCGIIMAETSKKAEEQMDKIIELMRNNLYLHGIHEIEGVEQNPKDQIFGEKIEGLVSTYIPYSLSCVTKVVTPNKLPDDIFPHDFKCIADFNSIWRDVEARKALLPTIKKIYECVKTDDYSNVYDGYNTSNEENMWSAFYDMLYSDYVSIEELMEMISIGKSTF